MPFINFRWIVHVDGLGFQNLLRLLLAGGEDGVGSFV